VGGAQPAEASDENGSPLRSAVHSDHIDVVPLFSTTGAIRATDRISLSDKALQTRTGRRKGRPV
jgi:hypothetical protein